MSQKLITPYGNCQIIQDNPQLTTIRGDSDSATYFGQGFATAQLRLWQLDLTRRVAAGTLSEILGKSALASDKFQRQLGLTFLANQAMLAEQDATQAAHIEAYLSGINHALEKGFNRPLEAKLVGYKVAPFSTVDIYLIAQLKYFINSAWQFEILHTLIQGKLGKNKADQLFNTFTQQGKKLPPLPREITQETLLDIEHTLQSGLYGLSQLGLDSPDIGSNVFACKGQYTQSGKPLLAFDQHMGHVNPGYNLLFRLYSDEGIAIFGSNFPGMPGILSGRNHYCSWGGVGVMADNQDLYWAEIDWLNEKVNADQAINLSIEKNEIKIKNQSSVENTSYRCQHGHLIYQKENHGLFLRWPALDHHLGVICPHQLSFIKDWQSFRKLVTQFNNAPMCVGYADQENNIGLQLIGCYPKRQQAEIGSLILSMHNPQHHWQGYYAWDELPSQFNPDEGYIIYANQYHDTLFSSSVVHLSNRWHPPTRAQRIEKMLKENQPLGILDLIAIQDDQIDGFAVPMLDWLSQHIELPSELKNWDGNTRKTQANLLFERWLQILAHRIYSEQLPEKLLKYYSDAWPGNRWNLRDILINHIQDWCEDELKTLLEDTLNQAKQSIPKAIVEFRHTLRRHPLLRWLLNVSYTYDGGTRETIHATRSTTDFLTSRQSENKTLENKKSKKQTLRYAFGPSFKCIFSFSDEQSILFLANMPSNGNPLRFFVNQYLRRWQKRLRYQTKL